VVKAVANDMIDGHLKEAPTPFLSGRSPRHAMQTLGTEWGRDQMNENFWVNITLQRVKLFDRVVISDVRFPNEVDMIRKLGGMVVRVERQIGDVPADLHPSEAWIPHLTVDAVLNNRWPSADLFKADVARFLPILLGRPLAA
jgi:hypothetical protein